MRRRIAVVTVAIAAMAALAGGANAAKTDEGDVGTIVELVSLDPNFSTLVSLVKAAGLTDALAKKSPHITVFAPDNAAFRRLEKATPGITKALTDPKNKKLLATVLRYHVVGQELSSYLVLEMAKKKQRLTSLVGAKADGRIQLGIKGQTFTLADSAGLNVATVIEPDVQADNGAIHVVDRVIVPKSIATALTKAGLLKS